MKDNQRSAIYNSCEPNGNNILEGREFHGRTAQTEVQSVAEEGLYEGRKGNISGQRWKMKTDEYSKRYEENECGDT